MTKNKRVFVVGGTGFLGQYVIQHFIEHGWEATALGLPPAPPKDFFPPVVKVVVGDLEKLSDKEILELLQGHEAIIYAAGMDDRYTPPAPAYPAFRKANVEIPARILTLAKLAGTTRAVVLGSYFAYFDRIWPHMNLAERHPYIRSRLEQERTLTAIPGLRVTVLELPYIFGDPKGRRPLWYPLVKYIRAFPLTFYMAGGTACIAASTVGKAAFEAIQFDHAESCYPIGQENLSWEQLLTRLAAADHRKIKVIPVPRWMIKIGMLLIHRVHNFKGLESGLNLRYFAELQTIYTYIPPTSFQSPESGFPEELDSAFQGTVAAC